MGLQCLIKLKCCSQLGETKYLTLELIFLINLQVLVEKLLRSCPDIRNIYLLIRPKRGQEVSARLTELLNAPVYKKPE